MRSLMPSNASNAPLRMNKIDNPHPVAESTEKSRKRISPFFALVAFPLVALTGLVFDLKTKDCVFDSLGMPGTYLVQTQPELQGAYWIWPDVFGFQTSLNSGALFGMGTGRSSLFAALSFVALAGILGWMVHSAWKSRLLSITLAMITAGILGNLYDRLGLHGLRWEGEPIYAVRDWILVMIGSYHWPNFNIADSLLVCGTILIVLYTFFEEKRSLKCSTDCSSRME